MTEWFLRPVGNLTNGSCCGIAFIVLLFIAVIITIACLESIEGFQPLVFTKSPKLVPGNCIPYSGCFFPSYMSNPINLKTGKRVKQPQENEQWCELSWRDCNAYQTCYDGKCISKV